MDEKPNFESLKQKLTFRQATEKDYQAVLDVNKNIYGGTDYIPAQYMKYVRDPHRILAVAEMDGKVVSLGLEYIVDDGLTSIEGAARVATNKQGTGIWHVMKDHLHSLPIFDNVRWIAGATPQHELIKKFWKRGDGYNIIMTRNLFKLHLSPDAPALLAVPFTTNVKTCILSKTEVMQAMENPDNIWQLFPHRKLVYSWDPYMLLKSNLERIYDDSFMWVATKDVTDDITSSCKSISIGRTHFIVKGTFYVLDFYGDSLEDLHNHLVMHMNAAQRISVHSGVHLELFLHRNLDEAKVHFVLDHIVGLNLKGTPLAVVVANKKLPKGKL